MDNMKSLVFWFWLTNALNLGYSAIIPSISTIEGPNPETDEQIRYYKSGVIITGDCSFKVNGDLTDPAPLFTRHNTNELLIPDPSDTVILKNGELLDMFCSSTSFVAPFVNIQKISAKCLQNKYFLVNETIYPFSSFSCLKWPGFSARRTGRPCNGGTDLVEVGFPLSDGGFLQTYDVCHDEINEVTPYVHHVLYPSSSDYQHGVSRPNFITLDFYGGRNVNNKYTQVQQNITISRILGYDASPYFNFSQNLILARGHLVAKTDMIFGVAHMATFLFINVAPQWQSFNGGNWERVESGVRKFVANNNLTTDCYTGTWGIATLPDIHGIEREIYLDFDENNNGLIPVPKLYFRVVIDRATRKGIVLVGVNNPYATLEQIRQEYILCKDIGQNITWIQWYKDNLHEGYSYACSVPDFTAVVKNLPLDDLYTTGILGIDNPNELTTTSPPLTTEGPTATQCYFNVNGDLNDPAPVFTIRNTLTLLQPNKQGLVLLKSGESFDMHCSNSFIMPFNEHNKLTATCAEHQMFLVNDTIHRFSNFSCMSWHSYEARRTDELCSGGSFIVEIGINLEAAFLPILNVCHSEDTGSTPYGQYELTPTSNAYQRFVQEPNYQRGDFYNGKDVRKLYTQSQQIATFSKLLNLDASVYFDSIRGRYLVPGQLIAKHDLIYGSEQRASYHYVNTSPQWHNLNKGNWHRIERALRSYVADNNLNVTIYAGTWGIVTLPAANGKHQPLYLDAEDGLLPVPKLYYRLIIDHAKYNGIALLSVNNPHATLDDIVNEYIICPDIADQITWLDWTNDNLELGYSYACNIFDFIKVVPNLPSEMLLKVNDHVLGIN